MTTSIHKIDVARAARWTQNLTITKAKINKQRNELQNILTTDTSYIEQLAKSERTKLRQAITILDNLTGRINHRDRNLPITFRSNDNKT